MHLFHSKSIIIRTLISTLFIFAIIECNSGFSSLPAKLAKTPRATKTSTVITGFNQAQSADSLNQNKLFNLSGLNIQATALACPLDDWLYHYQKKYSGGNVTLTDPITPFDDGAIARLTASINQDDPSLLPNGLTAVLAGLIDPSNKYSFACDSDLEITNTGQDIVQITQIALLYTANSQKNTSHYDLVDICSLPLHDKALCYLGRGATSDTQIYSFQLVTGRSGTIVFSQETQILSIMPGVTVKVELQMKPADASNSGSIYSFVPQLTLSTSSQPQKLSQLASRAVFVNSSQLACYQLRNDDTFSKMNNPTIPFAVGYYDPATGSGMGGTECI